MLSYKCGALIRDLFVGQRDVGQRVTQLNQFHDPLIRDGSVGQHDVGQLVAMLSQGRGAHICALRAAPDVGRRVTIYSERQCGSQAVTPSSVTSLWSTRRWTASDNTEPRP